MVLVVNGFFWDGKPVANQNTMVVHSTPLGVRITIKLSFSHSLRDRVRFRPNVGLKNDHHEAIERITRGVQRQVIMLQGTRILEINAMLLLLCTPFMGTASRMNEAEWQTYSKVTAICIGNAKYFGGGMKITPNAYPQWKF
ncbi:hypothetical protein REPUB_Repub02eG0188500 [Reevesia pubescens]